MGKQKFTVEEGSKISTFIRKWRKNNPNATEWPLDEIQQKLQVITGIACEKNLLQPLLYLHSF